MYFSKIDYILKKLGSPRNICLETADCIGTIEQADYETSSFVRKKLEIHYGFELSINPYIMIAVIGKTYGKKIMRMKRKTVAKLVTSMMLRAAPDFNTKDAENISWIETALDHVGFCDSGVQLTL